jgi:hypothetical protein
MKSMMRILSFFLAMALFMAPLANATGLYTPVLTVPVSTTVNESLSASIQSGTLDPSTSNALTLTVNYALIAANHTSGVQVAYWTSSTLTNSLGGPGVPSSNIELVNNGNATCTNSPAGIPGGDPNPTMCGAPQTLLTQTQLAAAPSGTTTASVSLAYASPVINPGTYTGTLSIVVWAV